MISFNCQHCRAFITRNPEDAGRRIPCPVCNQVIYVPPRAAAAPFAATPPQLPSPSPNPAPAVGMIRFQCPNCQAPMQVADKLAKNKGYCPKCGQRIQFPDSPRAKTRLANPMPGTSLLSPKPAEPEDEPVLDVLPVEEEEPKASGSTKPRQRKEARIPCFTPTGAVIECAHCAQRIRIRSSRFNLTTLCPACGGTNLVIVASEGCIPFECPHCGASYEADEGQANTWTDCDDCEGEFLIPEDEIMVKALQVRASQPSYPPVVPLGGRRCAICGRSIRNPTPFCYKCWPY